MRAALLTLAAGLVVPSAASAQSTSTPAGSAEQVYVACQQTPAPHWSRPAAGRWPLRARTRWAGLLFRNVTPGDGYRVSSGGQTSDPVTVHTTASSPWDPSIYNQTITDNGYQYLNIRDGTKLAIDVHPPTSPAGEPGVPAGVTLPPSRPRSMGSSPRRTRR